jgi:hypothetical protein
MFWNMLNWFIRLTRDLCQDTSPPWDIWDVPIQVIHTEALCSLSGLFQVPYQYCTRLWNSPTFVSGQASVYNTYMTVCTVPCPVPSAKLFLGICSESWTGTHSLYLVSRPETAQYLGLDPYFWPFFKEAAWPLNFKEQSWEANKVGFLSGSMHFFSNLFRRPRQRVTLEESMELKQQIN